MAKNLKQILEEIEFLYSQSSIEKRATTQPFVLEKIKEKFPDYGYKPEDMIIRESLIEHSGSLPIVATTLFPYLDDPDVDLGKSLTMLAIHDIGELVVGDEIVFSKTISKDEEMTAAKRLLNPIYYELYDDVESQNSKSAKFAKAIDKITPDILDYLTPPEITVERYKHFTGTDRDGIVNLIRKFKRPYMLWNPFMTEFHDYLMEQLERKISKVR